MTTRRPIDTNAAPLERIERATIHEGVSELLDEYDDLVGERDRFLWRWLSAVFPEIRLSCVPPEAGDEVRTAKLLTSLFVVVLDDLAEKRRDEATFREAAKAPFPHRIPDGTRPGVDGEVVDLAVRIWECVDVAIESAPRADEFRDVLAFDLRQNCNAISYSYLLNETLELASLEEAAIYDSYNMMLLTYADLDLLYSPAFDATETNALRAVVRRAQRMARIGNWITTWERELAEGDFSSGVVVHALETDVVTRAQLRRLREDPAPERRRELASRIREAGVEERLLARWIDRYEEVATFAPHLESVDVESYLNGMEAVLAYHFASRGLK